MQFKTKAVNSFIVASFIIKLLAAFRRAIFSVLSSFRLRTNYCKVLYKTTGTRCYCFAKLMWFEPQQLKGRSWKFIRKDENRIREVQSLFHANRNSTKTFGCSVFIFILEMVSAASRNVLSN